MRLDENLRELGRIEAPPERIDAVRARVLARIDRRRKMLPLVWAAGSMATLVLALWLWGPRAPEAEALRFAWAPPKPPGFAWSIPERKAAVPKPAARPRPEATPEIQVVDWTESTEERPGTALLELPSTDPNVVLYFIVDGSAEPKGE